MVRLIITFFENAGRPVEKPEQHSVQAVVTAQHRLGYTIFFNDAEMPARVSGRFMGRVAARSDYPAVGDAVLISLHEGSAQAVIEEVLPRKTVLARRKPDSADEVQTIAANVDIVFAVMGLDGNFSPHRLERLVAIARGCGAEPAVILTKRDIAGDALAQRVSQAQNAAGADVRVIALSGITGEGVPDAAVLLPGKTACFIGSSGTGKSTLINRLLGCEKARVGLARVKDSRGRHTTTARQLYFLPGGGAVIDTPGIREVGLTEGQKAGVEELYADIEALTPACRFTNCTHASEPDCAVKAAVAAGAITPERYRGYLKLKTETKPVPHYLKRANQKKPPRC